MMRYHQQFKKIACRLFEGDDLSRHSGTMFSTEDQDNDASDSMSCAKKFKSGWWYFDCYTSHLNGVYSDNETRSHDSVVWPSFKGTYSLKFTEMKMRPL